MYSPFYHSPKRGGCIDIIVVISLSRCCQEVPANGSNTSLRIASQIIALLVQGIEICEYLWPVCRIYLSKVGREARPASEPIGVT